MKHAPCISPATGPLVAVLQEALTRDELSRVGNTERKGRKNFDRSEREFLISYLDRHETWAVVVCLVGGGQEIHTGEAGIGNG